MTSIITYNGSLMPCNDYPLSLSIYIYIRPSPRCRGIFYFIHHHHPSSISVYYPSTNLHVGTEKYDKLLQSSEVHNLVEKKNVNIPKLLRIFIFWKYWMIFFFSFWTFFFKSFHFELNKNLSIYVTKLTTIHYSYERTFQYSYQLQKMDHLDRI